MVKNCEKMLFRGVKGVIIHKQKHFFKKTLHNIVVEVYGNVYPKKQIDWSIYEGGVAISVEKEVLEFQCEKSVFRPKIGQFSIFFKNILVIDKTTRNTYLVQIIAYLDLFYAFYGHFRLNLGPFLIYNFIYKTRAGGHKDVHVSGHNLRTEHAMKLSYGILDCP